MTNNYYTEREKATIDRLSKSLIEKATDEERVFIKKLLEAHKDNHKIRQMLFSHLFESGIQNETF